MTMKDSHPIATSDPTMAHLLQAILAGATIKIEASTQATAESVRQTAIYALTAMTTEPIESFILGGEPLLQICIRKLLGGRPKIWMCGCGLMGSEQEIKQHQCKKRS